MASLMIRDVPAEIHARLKSDAKRHHRSMAKHLLAILEQSLSKELTTEEIQPVCGRFPLTDEFLDRAKREGRA